MKDLSTLDIKELMKQPWRVLHNQTGTMYVIFNPHTYLYQMNTLHHVRKECIKSFAGNSGAWKAYYKRNWRCIKVRVRIEPFAKQHFRNGVHR